MTLNIGGYIPASFIDYPGKVAAVVFVNGCNLRCPYCHNQHLLNSVTTVPEAEVLEFLAARVGKLAAVVISGGEPTKQPLALLDFCKKVKNLGYYIKLDTNGFNPMSVLGLSYNKLIDYVAVDIKMPILRYDEVGDAGLWYPNQTLRILANKGPDDSNIRQVKIGMSDYNISVDTDIWGNTSLPWEVRTTVVKGMHMYEDLISIFDWIRPYASCWWLQAFKPAATVLNPKYDASYIPEHEMLVQVADYANSLGLVTKIR